jgi:hypothetical protein
MMPGWDVWFGIAAMALAAASLMAQGVLRLRAARGRKWKAISTCVFSVILCLSGLGASLVMSYQMDSLDRSLKNDPPPSYLPPDWAPNFTKEERSQHSQMLAKYTFINWGIHVNYFDLNGAFIQYQPTNEDRLARVAMLNYIERTELTRTLFIWNAVVWALIPWLALVVALMPWAQRREIALTSRSNADAPPSGGAPLS